MMQNIAIAGAQPVRLAIGAGVRWGALAFASIAVPVVVLAAALGQATSPASAPVLAVAPPAIEVPVVAPVSEPAPPIDMPVPPESSGTLPANPGRDLSQVDLYFDPECICLGFR